MNVFGRFILMICVMWVLDLRYVAKISLCNWSPSFESNTLRSNEHKQLPRFYVSFELANFLAQKNVQVFKATNEWVGQTKFNHKMTVANHYWDQELPWKACKNGKSFKEINWVAFDHSCNQKNNRYPLKMTRMIVFEPILVLTFEFFYNHIIK